MKKKLFLLFVLTGFIALAYAQKGDLYLGARGAYVTYYKDFLYGFRTGYHLADPLEVSLSFLMNPEIELENDIDPSKVKAYSLELNMCYYILLNRTWSMGPALGGEYTNIDNYHYKVTPSYSDDESYKAFNIGWHLRFNITDNIKLNGGWRYSMATNDMSHHTIYLGLGYTFNLF